MPQIVSKTELPQDNALNSISLNIARLIGSPVGGMVAGLFGLSRVVLVDAFSFLVAGILTLFMVIPATPKKKLVNPAVKGLSVSAVWSEWLEGFVVVGKLKVLTVLLCLNALTNIGEGILSVLVVVFIKTTLHGGPNEVGLFWGLQAAGGLVGGVLIGSLAGRFLPVRLLGLGSLGLGLLDLALFNYPSLIDAILPAYLIIIAVGIPVAAYQAGLNTLLQLAVKNTHRGRVLGAFSTTLSLTSLAGVIFVGVVANEQNLIVILSVQGTEYTLAGLLYFILPSTSIE